MIVPWTIFANVANHYLKKKRTNLFLMTKKAVKMKEKMFMFHMIFG